MQLPIFEVGATWTPPRMESLPSWASLRRVGIDTETKDPHLKDLGIGTKRGSYMVGVSFAIEDGPSYYLPIRHQGGDNLPEDGVLRYLRDQAAVFQGELVGANLSYDIDFLQHDGIHFRPKFFRDVQVADPIIYELHEQYSLNAICDRYGIQGKDETLLNQAARNYGVDPKNSLWRLPARYVGEYAEADANRPLLILRRQERIIEEQGLREIFDLECRVLPVLVTMRSRGIRIDEERLDEVQDWLLREEAKALERLFDITGHRVRIGDVWKTGEVAPALHKVGIEMEETSKGQPSIDKDLLQHNPHPAAQAVFRARKVNKIRTTYAESVRKHMVNGRIHPTFTQSVRESERHGIHGARFGRLSCVNPNLQNQPSSDEFGAFWRSIYLPEDGQLLASCDFSQQEPRWTTHYAAMLDLSGAKAAADRYRSDPTMDNHKFMAEITGLPRNQAKLIFLGLCYGEGGAKLCDTLGLPTRWALAAGEQRIMSYHDTRDDAEKAAEGAEYRKIWRAAGEEGQSILDKFNERAPYVRELAKAVERRAKQRGYIITAGGRRCRFPQQLDGSYDWTYKALNRLIQGSSADQTKAAIVAIHDNLPEFFLQLQIHDEILGSVTEGSIAKRAADMMADVMQTSVPFKVNVKLGANWGILE